MTLILFLESHQATFAHHFSIVVLNMLRSLVVDVKIATYMNSTTKSKGQLCGHVDHADLATKIADFFPLSTLNFSNRRVNAIEFHLYCQAWCRLQAIPG